MNPAEETSMALSNESKESKDGDEAAPPKAPPTRKDAVAHVRETIGAYEQLRKAEGSVKKAAERSTEALKAAQEQFEKTMEEGLPTSASFDQVKRKLNKITTAYQELKDAKLGGSEKRKAAKDKRAEAKQAFESMIEGSQLMLNLL